MRPSVQASSPIARHRDELKRLRKLGVEWPEGPPARRARAEQQPLAGLTVVLTGTLEVMTREQAAERLRALGAKVSGSVSKKTSYVVAGSEPAPSSRERRQLGVPVLDEAGLKQLLRGEQPHAQQPGSRALSPQRFFSTFAVFISSSW